MIFMTTRTSINGESIIMLSATEKGKIYVTYDSTARKNEAGYLLKKSERSGNMINEIYKIILKAAATIEILHHKGVKLFIFLIVFFILIIEPFLL